MINGVSNFASHLERPIADTLAYVPLNNLLTRALTSDNPADHEDIPGPIDFHQTHWDFDSTAWVVVYVDNIDQPHDPLTVGQELKTAKIAEVTRKLQMSDLSNSARNKLETYLTALNNIEVTVETVRDIVWPTQPF